jgi:protein-disulfide isomerase
LFLRKLRINKSVVTCLLFATSGVAMIAQPRHVGAAVAASQVKTEKVIQFIRERFNIPGTVSMSAEPLRPSSFAGLYETLVNTDDGKQKRSTPVYITGDARYLFVGNLFTVGSDGKNEIIRHVRDISKLPAATILTVGSYTKSPFPEFLRASLTADDGKNKQNGELWLTSDAKTAILGNVLPFQVDAERVIATRNQPSVGSPSAKVTIVEYADLQCPTCAKFHEFLEKQFLPAYGNRVRLVFKEFPLPMHDWSRTAAIANECAYQINPSAFLNYRTLIFANQSSINALNVRDQVLSLGDQAGIDRLKLSACVDAKASLPRIEADVHEAEKLGVSSTPTTFINGRIVVGAPTAAEFQKIVDEALAKR